MKSNGNLSDIVSMSEMTAGHHNLEEGDQLVLLNAIDVMHKDKNAKLDVFSVDTDVLVLLTGTYPLLPPMTCLLRKKGERIPIWESYHKLGRERESRCLGGMLCLQRDRQHGHICWKGSHKSFQGIYE